MLGWAAHPPARRGGVAVSIRLRHALRQLSAHLPVEPDSGNDLTEAVSFTAEENGERLFTGVVDECERGWDTAGGTLTVAGRGMAARLLDNEALGADYQVATVEDILRDHVAPYGIEIVRGGGAAAGAGLLGGRGEQRVAGGL